MVGQEILVCRQTDSLNYVSPVINSFLSYEELVVNIIRCVFIQSARRGTKRLKGRQDEVQLIRKRSSFCLYSCLLADMDIRIL